MKYYYGYIEYARDFGFLEENNENITSEMVEISEEQHTQLLLENSQGKTIVLYNGAVFAAPPNQYIQEGNHFIVNPNYESEQTEKRRVQFYLDFFQTSLGFIRRKPILANGTEDDFLNNDLPLLAIGLMTGSNPVLPIAYQLPDFTHELTQEYMESLQIKNQPITQQFIAECSAVKMKDFTG